MSFIASLVSIIIINIVLSGDNAVVIAMATMRLPEQLRAKAILWGSLGAVGLRIVLTVAVAWLLKIPLIQAVGGIALVYIAYNLLVKHDDEGEVAAGSSLPEAIRTIVIADFVMSLDNILAVGGASEGNLMLLIIGLVISMALIMWGSTLIAKLMERFPAFSYVGAGILIWTAGKMMVDDGFVVSHLHLTQSLNIAIPLTLMASVLGWSYVQGRSSMGKPSGRPTSGVESLADEGAHDN